jgi:predicted ATPase/class 3 adenylate cyclase
LLRLRVREEDARMERQPSGTVTLVFTDIEGSTQLLEELGVDAYRVALGEHRRVVREACTRYSGYEVDYEGDAFFYAFQSASHAVAAVGEFMVGLQDGPIRVRVGIHTGQPALDPPKYVGLDVHRAARLMASAHGGQVVVSSSTAALLTSPSNDQLQGLSLRDLGEHRFKDLAAPERVFQLGEGEFPPLRSLYRSNLPVPATPFLGREAELAEVVERLTDADKLLLTLTGPGGTGKTRLALQAAAEASDHFSDGVWWVPLAPLRDPALVLSSVAQVLEVSEEPGRELAETLQARLGGKRLLVLLDNVEHLLPEAASAVGVLRDIGDPVVLVTSRERLQLGGEDVYPVPPLASAEAVDLFLARARSVGAELEQSPALEELCARLDDLPLAIELAAARTVVFMPEQLLERIGQRLDLLKGGRDADPRQQTLRATIEWSYDLLADEEGRLLRALSVFAGGCTYDAAEEVCGADPDTLQSLLDKSLLRRRDTESGTRYWMLETIREYAAEMLTSSDEADASNRSHAEWCTVLAEELDGDLRGANTPLPMRKLEAEISNLRLAMESAASGADAALGARIAISLIRYWWMKGSAAEGRQWLTLFGARDLPPSLAWRTLEGAAFLTAETGDAEAAVRLAERAVASVRALDDLHGLGQALATLGSTYVEAGVYGQARATLAEAREILHTVGDRHGLAALTFNLGDVARREGALDEAEALYNCALTLAREIDAAEGVASCLLALGKLARQQGRPRDCLSLIGESLRTLDEMAFTPRLADAMLGIAEACSDLGESPRAARILGVVQSITEEFGSSFEPERCSVLESALGDVLDEGRIVALVEEGHSMALGEAIALAGSVH